MKMHKVKRRLSGNPGRTPRVRNGADSSTHEEKEVAGEAGSKSQKEALSQFSMKCLPQVVGLYKTLVPSASGAITDRVWTSR